jgi:hypothetical protein
MNVVIRFGKSISTYDFEKEKKNRFCVVVYKMRNDILTTFGQLSLSYSHDIVILSLPFSLSIVFDQ